MNKELVEEFVSEVRIGDKLKVVNANSLANYSFLFKYKRCFPNDSGIFFIDDEMNIIVTEDNQSIYDKVYIEKIFEKNTLGARIVNTLVHQYFIKGGKLGESDVEKVSFQKMIDEF